MQVLLCEKSIGKIKCRQVCDFQGDVRCFLLFRSSHSKPMLSSSEIRSLVILLAFPAWYRRYCRRWHLTQVAKRGFCSKLLGTLVWLFAFLKFFSSLSLSYQAALCESQIKPTLSRTSTRSGVMVLCLPSSISLYWYRWRLTQRAKGRLSL